MNKKLRIAIVAVIMLISAIAATTIVYGASTSETVNGITVTGSEGAWEFSYYPDEEGDNVQELCIKDDGVIVSGKLGEEAWLLEIVLQEDVSNFTIKNLDYKDGYIEIVAEDRDINSKKVLMNVEGNNYIDGIHLYQTQDEGGIDLTASISTLEIKGSSNAYLEISGFIDVPHAVLIENIKIDLDSIYINEWDNVEDNDGIYIKDSNASVGYLNSTKDIEFTGNSKVDITIEAIEGSDYWYDDWTWMIYAAGNVKFGITGDGYVSIVNQNTGKNSSTVYACGDIILDNNKESLGSLKFKNVVKYDDWREEYNTFGKEGKPARSIKVVVGEQLDIERYYGDTRYDTSKETAEALKELLGVDEFENIVVASGDNYPDALAGSYLAQQKNAPLLLVGTDLDTEEDMLWYIAENLSDGGMAYILGGEGVVTKRFENELDDWGINVKRLGGDTRYDTNIAILKEAGVTDEDLLICTADGYADSLSVSSIYKPVLIVAKEGLNDKQINYLNSLKTKNIYLIGGEGVVSNEIAKVMKKFGKVERVSGDDRYETSVAVAREFFGDTSAENSTLVLVYGMNFPDGLSGGPLAASQNAPLILAENYDKVNKVVRKYAGNNVKHIDILGGHTLISDAFAKSLIR